MTLVEIKKNEAITTSLIIAEGVKKEHKNVIELINRHKKDLEELGIITFETRKSRRGKPTRFCYLNETQTYFLITLMRNNEIVTKFKKKLVKEFMYMRKTLSGLVAMKQNEEWRRLRKEGKATRVETTDMIKQFVEYATAQGSANAKMYYCSITKMENKALFILTQKFPNIREVLNGQQLATLRVVDKMIEDTLQEGIEREMHYKEIYILARDRVQDFARLVRPSIVITSEIVKLIEE